MHQRTRTLLITLALFAVCEGLITLIMPARMAVRGSTYVLWQWSIMVVGLVFLAFLSVAWKEWLNR